MSAIMPEDQNVINEGVKRDLRYIRKTLDDLVAEVRASNRDFEKRLLGVAQMAAETKFKVKEFEDTHFPALVERVEKIENMVGWVVKIVLTAVILALLGVVLTQP